MNGMAKNKYSYTLIVGKPNKDIQQELLHLYAILFEDAKLDFFVNRIETKEDLVTVLCHDKETLIGFKLGYRYDENTLYSWVGGVEISYREQGVAQKLLESQHSYAKKNGYQKIRTKSMNRFKPMMILNLKNGFNIKNIYTNDTGQTKIVFEKLLF